MLFVFMVDSVLVLVTECGVHVHVSGGDTCHRIRQNNFLYGVFFN